MSLRRRLRRLEQASASAVPHACRIELVEIGEGEDPPPLPPCPECDRRGLIRRIEIVMHDGTAGRPLSEVVPA